MNNIKNLKNQQRENHPGFDSYLECMTRSLFSGLAAFVLTFSSTYFSQKLLAKQLPYQQKGFIALSALASTVISYKIVSDRTKSCQAAWMAAENKHTILDEE